MRAKNFSLLAVAVAAGLSLTACQGEDTASADANDSAAASRTTGGTDTGTDTGTGNGTDTGTGNGTGSGTDTGDNGDTSATSGTSASSASSATGSTGSGVGTNSGSRTCSSDQLALSQNHGMGEGDIVVHLKNTGDAGCRLQGFPGVDLKGADGTVSADRSDLDAPPVTVAPGDETRFTLHYDPNLSGGSGVTYTTLVVTPPDETHSLTIPVTVDVAVTDSPDHTLRVDPVGTGK